MHRGASRTFVAMGVLAVVVLLGALVVGDEPGEPRGGTPPLSFDPAADDVFATGTVGGAQWEAAAGYTLPPEAAREGDVPVLCLAMRWEPPEAGPQRHACSTRLADPEGALEVRTLVLDGGARTAVLGVVGDAVERLEWQLADAVVDVEVHDHPVVGQRVFAAVAAVDQPSPLVAYDERGEQVAVEEITAVDGGGIPSAGAGARGS